MKGAQGSGAGEGAGSQRTVCMADVARVAGVSQQTVSRVVNELPNVSERTRERVKAAMDELNPYAAIARAAEQKAVAENIKNKAANQEKKRAEKAKFAEKKAAYFENMML